MVDKINYIRNNVLLGLIDSTRKYYYNLQKLANIAKTGDQPVLAAYLTKKSENAHYVLARLVSLSNSVLPPSGKEGRVYGVNTFNAALDKILRNL